MMRRRAGRRNWLVAATLGIVVLLGGASPAAAAQQPPATGTDAQGPAETCSWDKTKKYIEETGRVDGKRDTGVWSATPRYDLRCSGPAPTAAADLPELPAGCTAALSGTTWTVTCNPPQWEPLEAHPCSWARTGGDDGDWTAALTCPDWVVAPTEEDKQPTMPDDCDRQTDGTLTCDGDVAGGRTQVDCRDERDWRFDDHQKVYLGETPPDWFVEAVELESGRDEGQACDLARNPPHKRCSAIDKTKYDPPGLLPDECWGTFPTSLYEISWEDGDWNDWWKYKTRLLGTVASVLFSLGRSAIQVVLWLLEWAFAFDVTQFSDEVSRIANVFNDDIVGSWGLVDIAWFVLIAYAAFAALRRKFGIAGGELLLSLVFAGLATVLFTNRDDYLDSMADATTLASDDLFAVGTEAGARTGAVDREKEILEPLQNQLHKEFVEEAYMYLNWGASSDQLQATSPTCLERAHQIASTGWDRHGWPAQWMDGYSRSDRTCDKYADFNREVKAERVGGALMTMAVSLVVTATIGLMAVTLLLTKFLLAVLFTLTPFVAVIAVLPGAGRRPAWTWVAATVQTFVVAVIVSWVTTMMLLGSREMIESTADLELHERWALLLLVVVGAYTGFQRARAASQTLAGSIADSLTRLSPAAAGWSGRGPVGFDFKGADQIAARGTRMAARTAAAPVRFAGRSATQRWQERRSARRSLGNLRYMERQRNRPAEEYRVDTYRYHDRAKPTGEKGKIQLNAPPGKPPGLIKRMTGGGSQPSGPVSGTYTPPPTVGVQDGEVRERWEMIGKVQAPPSALRHPIRHLQDRVHNRLTKRDLRRRAQAVGRENFKPDYFIERGMPTIDRNRPATAKPRSSEQRRAAQRAARAAHVRGSTRQWLPKPVRGRSAVRGARQAAARRRVPRGWA